MKEKGKCVFKRIFAALTAMAAIMSSSLLVTDAYAQEEASLLNEPPAAVTEDGESFDTLEEALLKSETGKTVTLKRDVILKDDYTFKKSVTINGNGFRLSANNVNLFIDSGVNVCFKGLRAVFTADDLSGASAYNWLMLCMSKGSSLILTEKSSLEMNFESSKGVVCAIYANAGTRLGVYGGSSFSVNGKNTVGKGGQAIQLDSTGAMDIEVKQGSFFTIDGANRGYVNSPKINCEDSQFKVVNCTSNASNGGDDTFKNSTVIYKNNAGHGLSATDLKVYSSILDIEDNGYCGISAAKGLFVDKKSDLTVRANGWNNLSGQAALRLSGEGKIESGSKVKIDGNYCSGIYLNKKGASLTVEPGAFLSVTENGKMTDGDHGYTTPTASSGSMLVKSGGGILNMGTAVFPEGAKIFNNYAQISGSDVYNTGNITLPGAKSMDGKKTPENESITGWYFDGLCNGIEAPRFGTQGYVEEYSPLEKDEAHTGLIAIYSYKLKYDENGMEEYVKAPLDNGTNDNYPDGYAINNNAVIKENTKDGFTASNGVVYEFSGWAEDKDAATADYKPGDKLVMKKDVTLYAVWRSKSASVTISYVNEQGEKIAEDFVLNGRIAQKYDVTQKIYEELNYNGNVYLKKEISDKSDGITGLLTKDMHITAIYSLKNLPAVSEENTPKTFDGQNAAVWIISTVSGAFCAAFITLLTLKRSRKNND